MTISDVCIKRPVFTWVLVAIPVVLGLVSYGELGRRPLSRRRLPGLHGHDRAAGASVEEMETTVTKPIEDIINTVSGIDELRSTTTEGVSIVTVQFLLSKNGDVGTQEVRDKVNTILADLPDGTDPPIVDKFDTGSMPVMTIAVSGRRDFREVTELARKQIKERLETVNGVGVDQPGRRPGPGDERRRSIPSGWPATTSRSKTSGSPWSGRTSRSRAAGSTKGRASWCSGRWAGCETEAEFNDLIVANRNGYPIRVRDVGRAEDSFEEPRIAGPARRRQRRQPGRPEAVGREHRQGRRGRQGPARSARRPPSPPTSPPRSSATSRGSSRSRSRR